MKTPTALQPNAHTRSVSRIIVLHELPAPQTVDWNALTPASREIAARIALRISAGLTVDEIVPLLNAETEKFRFNKLPKGRATKSWVLGRMRELRREIAETSSDD